MKVGILIVARANSKRLHNKHFYKIQNRSALTWLLDRIENEFAIEIKEEQVKISIATGNYQENNAFEKFKLGTHLDVFYDDDHNIPLRELNIAKKLGLDAIISVDGDDILCSPAALRSIYQNLLSNSSYSKTSGLPFGMNAFGVSVDFLEKSINNFENANLETGWGRIFSEDDCQTIYFEYQGAEQIRATLDYIEDVTFFDKVFELIPSWAELNDKELIRKINMLELFKFNNFKIKQYWENFDKEQSREKSKNQANFSERLHNVIPGGAHTYSRGDDQFPANAPMILERGKGTSVWSPDGKKFLDFGMALRSISIGYSEHKINSAAIRGLEAGNSLTRASLIELEAAELLVDKIASVDMVKFAKNGSSATTAAIKLARAFTGKKLIARCTEHPFFSFDDWFIGSTPIKKGITNETINDTKFFNYNNIKSLQNLIETYPEQIACVILEPAATECPNTKGHGAGCCGQKVCTIYPNNEMNFLKEVSEICTQNGILFILDETITGFRWSTAGAQSTYGVIPDLTTFGKAMANGFSVAAVGGRREIMQLGSIKTIGQERTFLLSSTHGAEMSGLSAFIATVDFIEKNEVIRHIWEFGAALKNCFNKASMDAGLLKFIHAAGPAANPYFVTVDENGNPWYELRTLFLQEMIHQGVLMPWISICFRHDEKDLAFADIALNEAMQTCALALKNGFENYLRGETIKPVFRRFN